MLRRIYFAIPDTAHARRIVTELGAAGIGQGQIHAAAMPGVDLSGLPVATTPQREDRVWLLDKLFWKGNLWLFAIAALTLIVSLLTQSIPWGLTALAIMLATYLLGRHFASRIPHAHIGEMRVPLAHGEVVLMIDVPRNRVREVEQQVSRHHPEASVSGIGWSMPALGT